MTWGELVKREPRLAVLEREIRVAVFSGVDRPELERLWARGFKRKMSQLIGWYRDDYYDDVLCSSDAYLTALQHLYGLLENRSRAGRSE